MTGSTRARLALRVGWRVEWERLLNENLHTADILLLLVNADFFASDYCYEIEVPILRRHSPAGDRMERQRPRGGDGLAARTPDLTPTSGPNRDAAARARRRAAQPGDSREVRSSRVIRGISSPGLKALVEAKVTYGIQPDEVAEHNGAGPLPFQPEDQKTRATRGTGDVGVARFQS
jgi:hypothetical protein